MRDAAIFAEWLDSGDPVLVAHARHRIEGRVEQSYPSIGQQAGNLARSLWDWAVSGFSAASEEEQARRMATCRACPELNAEGRRCWKCGCFTDLKIKLRTEHCPIGKW